MNKRFFALVAMSGVCACGITGCLDDKGEETTSPVEQKVDAPSASVEKGSDSATVVVTVNGEEITRSEVDRILNMMMSQYGASVPPDQAEKMRGLLEEQAREAVISQHLLLEEVERREIEIEDEAIDEQMRDIVGRFPSRDEFEKYLHSSGMTEEKIREEIRRNMLIDALLNTQVKKGEEITDEKIAAFYRDNPDMFTQQERVKASHILLQSPPDEEPEERAGKREKLAGLRDEIKKGADFAELAAEYSDCPSKAKGGDLGFFGKGQMVKPFEEAAFSMEEGEVSDVIETQFGYHLIKVTGSEKAGTRSLDEARDDIISYLKEQQQGEGIQAYVRNLRDAATIEYRESPSE